MQDIEAIKKELEEALLYEFELYTNRAKKIINSTFAKVLAPEKDDPKEQDNIEQAKTNEPDIINPKYPIYISYFYRVRFFKPNVIPLSTAVWDPAWYHTNGNSGCYIDKNGVYNGLRAEILSLPTQLYESIPENEQCSKKCPHVLPDNQACAFMNTYYEYLKTLSISDIVARCEKIGDTVKAKRGFKEEPIIVLMVHEAEKCPCGERPVLKQWFADHGYELKEWAMNY